MSARTVRAPLLLALLVVCAGSLRAQQGITELGFDMALAYETESEVFSISVPFGGTFGTIFGPQGGVRVGFFLSDALALEPTASFQLINESGGELGDGETTTALGSAVKLLYHFSVDPAASRFYVGAGPTFTWIDFGSDDSDTQFGLTGELVVKLPIAERIGARLAAGFMHGFENDDVSDRNVIYGTAGISVFLGGS